MKIGVSIRPSNKTNEILLAVASLLIGASAGTLTCAFDATYSADIFGTIAILAYIGGMIWARVRVRRIHE